MSVVAECWGGFGTQGWCADDAGTASQASLPESPNGKQKANHRGLPLRRARSSGEANAVGSIAIPKPTAATAAIGFSIGSRRRHQYFANGDALSRSASRAEAAGLSEVGEVVRYSPAMVTSSLPQIHSLVPAGGRCSPTLEAHMKRSEPGARLRGDAIRPISSVSARSRRSVLHALATSTVHPEVWWPSKGHSRSLACRYWPPG